MAKMIPPQIEDGDISAGEQRVFSLLQGDPDATNWTVLHSLGLARRTTGPYGEIDFVVIVPGRGVICLEVKGGRVSCEAGVWRTMDRRGNVALLKKSPFFQARDSMFALRKAMGHHFGEGAPESRCPVGCAVVFPDVSCPPLTPEFERSDVIDFDDLRGPISKSIIQTARRRLDEFQPRGGERLPTAAQAKAITNFLRPDFDLVVAKGVSIGRIESKLLRLTEEQYARLDELEANPRCLFEGAAGTGKTLLALEYARRVSRAGAKVLLVCFNRLLGERLQEHIGGIGVTAGTWHGITRRLILESSAADEFMEKERAALEEGNTRALFGELYPFYGEIALEELGTPFDVLVVDEAQDLCKQHVLDVLNLTIPGGLAGGRWAIFGDFTRQALYGIGEEPVAVLSRYSEHFVRARLTLNCRNTRRIAEETTLLAGFENPPFRWSDARGLRRNVACQEPSDSDDQRARSTVGWASDQGSDGAGASPMNETLAARDFIVDFLRRELVGPSPGHPAVQIDGEEILRPQDPPRQRYGAGILFPMRAQVLSQDETAADEDVAGDAESPAPDGIVESPEGAETEAVEISPGEIPPDTDRDVTLANEFLPSAMGLTALVEVPDDMRVDVSAGIYGHEELQWETRRDKDGREFYTKWLSMTVRLALGAG